MKILKTKKEMPSVPKLFLILLALYQLLPLNSELYSKMQGKNLSSDFSELHLLRVYESLFDIFHCLTQCNIIDSCKTVKIERNNQKFKCSIFDFMPNNVDILKDKNDIDLYLKLGIKFYN